MAKQKRRMAGTKEAVVLRLLHGEDMETVSRESGFGLHELKKWSDQYKRGGREALKRPPGIADDLELEQARRMVGQWMETYTREWLIERHGYRSPHTVRMERDRAAA